MENSILQEQSLLQSQPAAQPSDLVTLLSQKVVGQSAATKAIVPYVYMYQSGLAPEGRPAGELKRTIHRQLTQPLATMVTRGEILPGDKPFLAQDVLNLVRGRISKASAAAAV